MTKAKTKTATGNTKKSTVKPTAPDAAKTQRYLKSYREQALAIAVDKKTHVTIADNTGARFHPQTPYVQALLKHTTSFVALLIEDGEHTRASSARVGGASSSILVALNDPGEGIPAAYMMPATRRTLAEEVSTGFTSTAASKLGDPKLVKHARDVSEQFIERVMEADEPNEQIIDVIAESDAATIEDTLDIYYHDRNQSGTVKADSQANIIQFLEAAGISLQYDTFLGKKIATTTYPNGKTKREVLTSKAAGQLWRRIHASKCTPKESFFYASLNVIAAQNTTHAVCDYLDSLEPKWMGSHASKKSSSSTLALKTHHYIVRGGRRSCSRWFGVSGVQAVSLRFAHS